MTTVTSDMKARIDFAFGNSRIDHKDLSPQEQAYVLREFIKRYVTPEMVKFMPLWDIGTKTVPTENGGSFAIHGARLLEQVHVLHKAYGVVKRGDHFFRLWTLKEMPELVPPRRVPLDVELPISAGYDGPPMVSPIRPEKGEMCTSEVLLVRPKGEIIRWENVWKADEASHFTGWSGEAYDKPAIIWRMLSFSLMTLSDEAFADLLAANTRAFGGLMWHIGQAIGLRRSDLESRLKRFKDRAGDFYSDSYKFFGPTRN